MEKSELKLYSLMNLKDDDDDVIIVSNVTCSLLTGRCGGVQLTVVLTDGRP